VISDRESIIERGREVERGDEPYRGEVVEEMARPATANEVTQSTVSQAVAGKPQTAGNGDRPPLFANEESGQFRNQWQDVQAAFVDDPRSAVKRADELVSSATTRLAKIFSDERAKMEHGWDRGENVSTEDLRLALQRYRSFFDRILTV
jgi:hypothetical protein